MNARYYNSTFRIKADAKQMKRGGRLRPIRKTHPESDARLKQDLTKVLSKYVQLRDPICVVCRLNESTQAGHFFHRDMPSVEFDPRNVWGICSDCNQKHETNGQPMRDAVLARLGEQSFADLTELANNHKMKLGRNELEILLTELIEKVEDQTGIKWLCTRSLVCTKSKGLARKVLPLTLFGLPRIIPALWSPFLPCLRNHLLVRGERGPASCFVFYLSQWGLS